MTDSQLRCVKSELKAVSNKLHNAVWSTVVEKLSMNLSVLIYTIGARRFYFQTQKTSISSSLRRGRVHHLYCAFLIQFYHWMKKMNDMWGRAVFTVAVWTTGSSGCLLFIVTEPTAICHADGASMYSSTRSPSPPLIHQVRADKRLWT